MAERLRVFRQLAEPPIGVLSYAGYPVLKFSEVPEIDIEFMNTPLTRERVMAALLKA
jgi:hypothetical protein